MLTISHCPPVHDYDSIVGIDPSINEAGVAVVTASGRPTSCIQISARRDASDHWQAKATYMAHQIATTASINGGKRCFIVIETPGNWFTTKGVDSKNNGAVQKLYCVVGMIIAACQSLDNAVAIATVEPSGWKGQTPKPIMEKRCHKMLEMHGMHCDLPYTDSMEALMLAHKVSADLARQSNTVDIVWRRYMQPAQCTITSII
jgi:hypothetical protein